MCIKIFSLMFVFWNLVFLEFQPELLIYTYSICLT